MHAPPLPPDRSPRLMAIGGVLFAAGAIALGIWLSGSRMSERLAHSTEEARLAQLQLDLTKLETQLQTFASTHGWMAVTASRFDAESQAPGGLLTHGAPVPPPAVLAPGSPGRYELEVADVTGPRGIDHVLLMRGVTEPICRAFQAKLGNALDPLQPPQEDPFVAREGCTRLAAGGLTLFKTLSVQ